MNSLEGIRELLETYLDETRLSRQEEDFTENIDVLEKKGINQRVYDAFFNLFSDPNQTPEKLRNLLQGYTSQLDGLSEDKILQSLIGFTCFEALAYRNVEVLTEPWENLLWNIVRYLSCDIFYSSMYDFIKETKLTTLPWIKRFCSQKLCPDPCLRLELFRALQVFRRDCSISNSTLKESFIITLLELSDKYESLTVDKLPNFSPKELSFLIRTHSDFSDDDAFFTRKPERIAAVLKLTKTMILLEKEKCRIQNNPFIMPDQLGRCENFCGLFIIDYHSGDFGNFIRFIQAVSNNPLLLNHVIDTLETVTQVALCFPEQDSLKKSIDSWKSKLFHVILKYHIHKVPKNLNQQEINGGYSPAMEYCLKYIQINIFDHHNKYNKSVYTIPGFEYDSDSTIPDSEGEISDEDLDIGTID